MIDENTKLTDEKINMRYSTNNIAGNGKDAQGGKVGATKTFLIQQNYDMKEL